MKAVKEKCRQLFPKGGLKFAQCIVTGLRGMKRKTEEKHDDKHEEMKSVGGTESSTHSQTDGKDKKKHGSSQKGNNKDH